VGWRDNEIGSTLPAPAVSDSVRVLVVKESSGVERVIPLEDERRIVIGRDPGSTIRLDSPYVSRPHARIECRDGVAAFTDLGSRNGSRLNGERIAGTIELKPGDVITIGDATIECLAETSSIGRTRTLVDALDDEPVPNRLYLDPGTYEVRIGDRPLERRLSAQEFELLRVLYEHRDRVCKRQELGDAVWGANKWDTNMLHKLMHRLKDKVEPDAGHPRYVQTVPWVGYRLIE